MTIETEVQNLSHIDDLEERTKEIARIYEKHVHRLSKPEPSRNSLDVFGKAYEELVSHISEKHNVQLYPYHNGTWIGDLREVLNFFRPKRSDNEIDNADRILSSKFLFRPSRNDPLFNLDF